MSNGQRILIVDDDVNLSKMIKGVLELQGHYEVMIQNDGMRTIEAVYQFHPELILLDVSMPGIQGYEVCKKLKEDKVLHFIKVIFVSGNITTQDRLKGYEAGADDYIIKPFHKDELIAKVKVYLKLKYSEELNRIKSNVLSLFDDDQQGSLMPIVEATDFFNKKVKPQLDAKKINKQAQNKIFQGLGYMKNAMLLCELKKKSPNLSRGSVSIDEILAHVLHSLDHAISHKELIFNIEEIGRSRSGELNKSLMLKAFKSVLDNVIKYSPNNEEYLILINYEDSKICEVQIYDSGQDLDRPSLERVFSEFNSCDFKHCDRGGDLSFAVARRIMRIHGGDLYLETDRDRPCWIFRIPFSLNVKIDPILY